ncbi:DUF2441 domain-containing protein [Chitinophagaceae bacterium 26-R-25]|nr:DUF2441 domain-containing protein [Chitinophagaceae bacterium 26-R-25]
MNTYYHINRNPDCQWKAGDEFDFGHEFNPYWRSFLEKGASIKLSGDKHDAAKVIKTALNWYSRREPVPLQMKGYHFNSVFTLKEATDCLVRSINIIRELTLEAIRKEFYPELPSRHKCIWLSPDDELSLQFWKNLVYGSHNRIFRVEAEGIIHRTAQKWLIMGTAPLNEINSLAHNYWEGNEAGGIEDEIIFAGKLKIIEELIDI